MRRQFAAVDKLFDRQEARVLRDGNNVIIRLIGLNFAVGKAELEPKYFDLLSKVQNAINTFPDAAVTVEGHTDSHGSDNLNLDLSQQRADAVKSYLMANMKIEKDKLNAIGHGETRPIANNETKEGRAKNRRIDLVIQPDFQQ